MNTTLLALALAFLASPPAGDPRTQTLPREPGPRTEHFLLETSEDPARCVGAVVLRRRASEGGFQLEAEWQFDRAEEEGGDEQVLHIEQLAAAGSKLIWREWGSSRARSLVVTRNAEGREIAFVDTSRGGSRKDTIAADTPWFPLELFERLRTGAAPPGACARFDPLSRSIESVDLKLVPKGLEPAARAYELVRADGTSAGSCEFLGTELRSFRCHQGGLVARRVDEAEYLARSPRTSVTIRRP
ncbi:MAG: hypothetical protein ACKVXR_00680 [Planctomycetota bacterium]